MIVFVNLAIFVITAVLIIRGARENGAWNLEKLKDLFRYFTVESNALCAFSALLMAGAELAGNIPDWVWMIKYIGTASVTVTLLTVVFFLAPSLGKDWKTMFRGPNFFMHLITPLLAIISFSLLEKRGMTFSQSLWGLLPIVLYGPMYLYRIKFAPEGKRWEDFYGFNKEGKWPIAFAAMLVGTILVCVGLMALQNA